MTTENQKASEKTSIDYVAYSVEKRGKKTFWTRVGAGWFHEDGDGFTAKLGAIPVNGEIVFRKPKTADEAATGEQAGATEGEGA